MKTAKTIFIGSIVIISMLLCLTGCDKDNGTSSKNGLVGTWKMTKMKMEMGGISMELTAEAMEMSQTLVINSDGTYVMTMTDEDGTETDSGKWSISGSTLTIDSDDPESETETAQYKLEGNILTVTITEEEEDENGDPILIPVLVTFIRQ